jgi:glycosyltransferase involved in cell wall biosynthesis
MRPARILVYGDVDMNVIDGSSIWQQSMVTALQHIPRTQITVQLKCPRRRDLLTAPLDRLDRVELLDQPPNQGRRLRPDVAPAVLSDVDERKGPFDVILLRGLALSGHCARDRRLQGRLWCYLTDFPDSAEALTPEIRGRLDSIAGASERLLCQTDEIRSFLETHVPASRGKTALVPPMVPDIPADRPTREVSGSDAVRLVYVGKFARLWAVEELVEAVDDLREALPQIELVVAGDKFHNEPEDPDYPARMERLLTSTEGVEWLGAMERDEVQKLISTAHFGISLRNPSLDQSLQLSTKVLEYGRAGVPPVLSGTAMHQRLLGVDYPLYVGYGENLGERLRPVIEDRDLYSSAADAAWRAAGRHTFEAVRPLLQALVDQSCPDPVVRIEEPRRVLMIGHTMKFARPLIEHFSRLPLVELRVEEWPSVNEHDERASKRNIKWADAIFAEWCLANVVWCARHRRPNQRMVCRFHLFERDTAYPDLLEPDSVDHLAFVGEHLLREMEPRLALEGHQLSVIPNAVPTATLRRPKLPGAAFSLGILGISPMRKRLDLAIETLRRLRQSDDRFKLYVKGQLPIDHWWVWSRPRERDHFLRLGERIAGDPLLRDAVIFDPPGNDVPEWFRKVGFILSMSDFESFHIAVAEGIGSGATPVIRDWEGADKLYPDHPVVSDPAEAAELILEHSRSQNGGDPEHLESAIAGDRRALDVCRQWERLLLGA